MTGGGPAAIQGLASSKPSKIRYLAAFSSQPLTTVLSLTITAQEWKQPACHCLEAVRQLEAKSAAILLDNVLNVEAGSGIPIAPIQKVVNAG